jgi:DNA-binding NtrC family response regulator
MKRILIAEDDQDIRNILTMILEGEGYEIIQAENGDEALKTIRTQHIDLLLLDIKMPKLSGIDVLYYMHKEGYKIPVIILTAYSQAKEDPEVKQENVLAFLVKPISFNELKSKIKDILQNW